MIERIHHPFVDKQEFQIVIPPLTPLSEVGSQYMDALSQKYNPDAPLYWMDENSVWTHVLPDSIQPLTESFIRRQQQKLGSMSPIQTIEEMNITSWNSSLIHKIPFADKIFMLGDKHWMLEWSIYWETRNGSGGAVHDPFLHGHRHFEMTQTHGDTRNWIYHRFAQ